MTMRAALSAVGGRASAVIPAGPRGNLGGRPLTDVRDGHSCGRGDGSGFQGGPARLGASVTEPTSPVSLGALRRAGNLMLAGAGPGAAPGPVQLRRSQSEPICGTGSRSALAPPGRGRSMTERLRALEANVSRNRLELDERRLVIDGALERKRQKLALLQELLGPQEAAQRDAGAPHAGMPPALGAHKTAAADGATAALELRARRPPPSGSAAAAAAAAAAAGGADVHVGSGVSPGLLRSSAPAGAGAAVGAVPAPVQTRIVY
eukprot:TRINITY_DN4836_c0_g1_i1.p1 TRINITY_DN4836_c0_g1~~TRINITY_DN4836_c0_g1_i1.p1  ORF type:complete len:292 (+),score=60.74 TRINITY_DN4836_c0_g1_i1:90-878(+)